ncbi:hypothetical protein T484DRAFT_1590495, partial [Baffinella frigidus]
CTACAAGTYKVGSGTGVCLACGAGYYTDAVASTSSELCNRCPAQTSSQTSGYITSCICVSGYTAESDGVACSACEAGKFKSVTGAEACSSCPAGTFSS